MRASHSISLASTSDTAFHRAVPLYYRLSLLLKERIQSGTWPRGSAIPGELQFCREFKASRGTVAQAIALLVEEGLLVRRRGRGTFVVDRVPISATAKLNGPVGDYLYQDIPVKIARADKVLVEPPRLIAGFFRLAPGEKAVRIRRLRTSDGIPLSYAINYLPLVIGRRIGLSQLRRQSMLRTLEKDLGLALGPIRQSIEVALADVEAAKALKIPLSTPALLIQMEIRTREGGPVSHGQTYFRADRYRYTVEFARISGIDMNGASYARSQADPKVRGGPS